MAETTIKGRRITIDQNMPFGTFKITGMGDPTSAQDAATKAYVDAAVAGNTDYKQSVRVATTANITLSGTQTIDGVSVIATDRVLVKNQTTGQDNGWYVCAAGAWSRSTDADTSAEVTSGAKCYVEEGTANGGETWQLITVNPIVLGTTPLVFSQVGGINPSFADNETPSGTINGSNVTFTLANTPSPAASLQLTLDGQLMQPSGADYTLATATITFVTAPPTGAVLRAFYRF